MSTLKYRDSNNDYQGFFVKVTDTLPVGAIYEWGGITAPSGYLICDGRAVSRTEYADLFKAIGTNFGSGDGLTTFNIPDHRGRVTVGLDVSDVAFDTIGKTGGEKTHTLTVDEIPSHTHKLIIANNSNGGSGITTLATGPHTYSDDLIQSTGGGQAHNNLQPYTVRNFIIKASNKVALERGNVVDSLTGEDTDSAPSVRAVKAALVETYSTDEVKTNKTWIDGKPIYRKTFSISTSGTNATWSTNLSSVNCDAIIKVFGIAGTSSLKTAILSDTQAVVFRPSSKAVEIYFNNPGTDTITGYITIEYTKTTD